MHIEIKVDEVTLATVVDDIIGHDEETGEPYQAGRRTIGDLVAAQLVDRVTRETDRYRALVTKVTEIRTELIRETIRPQLEQALAAPLRKTNSYGEATGQESTLREVIVAEAKAAMSNRDRNHGSGRTWIEETVAAEVRKVLADEITQAVKTARTELANQISASVATAVQAGLRSR